MSCVLKAEGLTKRYHHAAALDGLDLQLPAGKIIGLLGPNGSGKTTFMKIAAGLLTPTTGQITVCGQAIGPKSKALVSYLPDRNCFSKRMKVAQMLDCYQDFFSDFDRARAEDMLSALAIDRDARFQTLSKGTQEKVQLVLTMSRRARLYLLDEPIGGVDPAARDYILSTILNNYQKDATVILSTHLIGDIEPILDEAIFLKDGRVFAHRNAEELRETEGKSVDAYFREVF